MRQDLPRLCVAQWACEYGLREGVQPGQGRNRLEEIPTAYGKEKMPSPAKEEIGSRNTYGLWERENAQPSQGRNQVREIRPACGKEKTPSQRRN